MATIVGFESTLKEVVHAKRLSASKIEKLSEAALQLMEHDTQLVTILYRTHKSLSGVSKIHSLYAFDALARAARNQVVKHKADVHAVVGNCATFLIKVEGVLEGLIQDMLSSTHPEAKEKTKKILDIWLKTNTFPSAVLARLHKLVKEAEKEPDKTTAVTADPRTQSQPSNITPPQPAAPSSAPVQSPESVQTALLALLSQAANAAVASGNGQTVPNIVNMPPGSGPHMVPTQLAVFQQLAQASNAGPVRTVLPDHRNPVPVSVVPPLAPRNVPPVAPPIGAPAQNLPFRDDRNGLTRREPQYDRFNGPHRGRDPYDHRDQRGGLFRGRGRGRGRWDDRDRPFERNRGSDWGAQPGRNYRSRSRSPVGRNGRDTRLCSPPRKQTFLQSPPSPPLSVPPVRPEGGKDEFGRDLRPSADGDSSASANQPELSPSHSASITVEDQTATSPDRKQHEAVTTSASQTTPLQADPAFTPTHTTATSGAVSGLDSFDLATFDPTHPASWEALGKAWNVSHGYMPSQAELMQHIMSMNMPATFPIASSYDEEPARQWPGRQEDDWGRVNSGQRGRSHRGSFGRGYNNHGNGRGGYRGRGSSWDQDTDALTLAGGEESIPHTETMYGQTQGYSDPYGGQMQQSDAGLGPVGKAGKMQRVGDKWVFVRAEATGVA